VYDMIPEALGFNLAERRWREKDLSILFARRRVCISEKTRDDLLRFYPELDGASISVAPCGVDRSVFRPAADAAIAGFRARHGLSRPYIMVAGARSFIDAYKNGAHVLATVRDMAAPGLDIVCTG